jgi:anti-anti-sigma regulatory factor
MNITEKLAGPEETFRGRTRLRGTHMPFRVTQNDTDTYSVKQNISRPAKLPRKARTVLKVEGSLYLEDAELLERICREVKSQTGRYITLDLEDISFLDSESASVLCRLKREQNVVLRGLHLFIGKVIELTEAEAKVSAYLRSNGTQR